jgi:hypothetical protein
MRIDRILDIADTDTDLIFRDEGGKGVVIRAKHLTSKGSEALFTGHAEEISGVIDTLGKGTKMMKGFGPKL